MIKSSIITSFHQQNEIPEQDAGFSPVLARETTPRTRQNSASCCTFLSASYHPQAPSAHILSKANGAVELAGRVLAVLTILTAYTLAVGKSF